jgi:hypothetical protein
MSSLLENGLPIGTPLQTNMLAASFPSLPNMTLELDRLLSALFFVALLLYLIPAAFGIGSSPKHRKWFQLAALITLTIAIAIAVIATVIWFTG